MYLYCLTNLYYLNSYQTCFRIPNFCFVTFIPPRFFLDLMFRVPQAPPKETPQRRPPLLVINSDAIRSSTPSPPHSTDGPKDGNHKRINYNYHPIIDFFQQQEPAPEVQERSGEDWKPIDVRPDAVQCCVYHKSTMSHKRIM